MITKTSVSQTASQCPRHPDIRILRKDVSEKLTARLLEFYCAVDDCNHPLGWNYEFRQGGAVRTMSGPGAIRNQDVRAQRTQG